MACATSRTAWAAPMVPSGNVPRRVAGTVNIVVDQLLAFREQIGDFSCSTPVTNTAPKQPAPQAWEAEAACDEDQARAGVRARPWIERRQRLEEVLHVAHHRGAVHVDALACSS